MSLATEIKDLEKVVQRHNLVQTQRDQLEQLKTQRRWAEIQEHEAVCDTQAELIPGDGSECYQIPSH